MFTLNGTFEELFRQALRLDGFQAFVMTERCLELATTNTQKCKALILNGRCAHLCGWTTLAIQRIEEAMDKSRDMEDDDTRRIHVTAELTYCELVEPAEALNICRRLWDCNRDSPELLSAIEYRRAEALLLSGSTAQCLEELYKIRPRAGEELHLVIDHLSDQATFSGSIPLRMEKSLEMFAERQGLTNEQRQGILAIIQGGPDADIYRVGRAFKDMPDTTLEGIMRFLISHESRKSTLLVLRILMAERSSDKRISRLLDLLRTDVTSEALRQYILDLCGRNAKHLESRDILLYLKAVHRLSSESGLRQVVKVESTWRVEGKMNDSNLKALMTLYRDSRDRFPWINTEFLSLLYHQCILMGGSLHYIKDMIHTVVYTPMNVTLSLMYTREALRRVSTKKRDKERRDILCLVQVRDHFVVGTLTTHTASL